MLSVTVTLLAYKEEDNLKVLIPKIIHNLEAIGCEYEIQVIDTEEPLDNTESVCKAFGAIYRNQEYTGFGGALKTAIKYANKELFLILDSDGSHNPQYIPDLYQKFVSEKCDLVIGSRYVPGGKTLDKKSSIVMSRLLNFVFRIFLGIQAKDISTDFRLYKTEQLKLIDLTSINYDVLQEVILKLKLNNPGFRICEIPITFEKRKYGESKRKLIPFIISYIKSLLGLTALRFPQIKKLLFYGIIGLIGAVIDFTIYMIATFSGIFPEAANILGALCGFIFTFISNSFLNFKKTSYLLKRFISYGSICTAGIVISTALISFLKGYCNVYVLKLGVMFAVSLLQFYLNQWITYRK